MADDFLTICQNVADAANLSRPSAIIGSTNETAKRCLTAGRLAIKEMARRHNSHWSDLERVFEFNPALSGTADGTSASKLIDTSAAFVTSNVSVGDHVENTTDTTSATVTAVNTAGTEITLDADIFVSGEAYTIYRQSNALPTDFDFWVDVTGWNKDTYWSLRGPMTPMEWRHYKHSVLGNSVTLRNRWRILPYLDADGKFINKALFLDPAPTESQDFVMEYVSNGLVYTSAGISQTTWKADTDTPVLDQHLLELNMIWRVLNKTGLPYAEELDEYETQVDAAIGRDGGGRVLDLARTSKPSFLSSDNVPDTGIGQ